MKLTHIPAKAIGASASNIIASTSNYKIYSIITSWSGAPFGLQRNRNMALAMPNVNTNFAEANAQRNWIIIIHQKYLNGNIIIEQEQK